MRNSCNSFSTDTSNESFSNLTTQLDVDKDLDDNLSYSSVDSLRSYNYGSDRKLTYDENNNSSSSYR